MGPRSLQPRGVQYGDVVRVAGHLELVTHLVAET